MTVGVASASEALDRMSTLKLFGLERVNITDWNGRVMDDVAWQPRAGSEGATFTKAP